MCLMPDNSIQAGYWKDWKLTGQGWQKTREYIVEGNFMDGQLQGQGKYKSLISGEECQGEWNQGSVLGNISIKSHGFKFKGRINISGFHFGTCIWSDRVYRGYWKNGQGILHTIYFGYLNGYIQINPYGYGSLRTDEIQYQGQLEFGVIAGQGLYRYRNEYMYIGIFKEGEVCGQGCMLNRQFIYFGDLYHHEVHGQGIGIWNDGVSYKGQWRNTFMHNSGIIRSDEFIYVGCFKFGRQHGIGSYIWQGSILYNGDWKNDKRSGTGISISAKYIQDGNWKDNDMSGNGKLIFDHFKYFGHFRTGLRHGFGIMYFQGHQYIIGYWQYGRLIDE